MFPLRFRMASSNSSNRLKRETRHDARSVSSSSWIGGAEPDRLRSRLAPWLDTFRDEGSAHSKEIPSFRQEEVLRRFIRGEYRCCRSEEPRPGRSGILREPEE